MVVYDLLRLQVQGPFCASVQPMKDDVTQNTPCKYLYFPLPSNRPTLPITLQWRRNKHDCVSNHRRLYCLFNRLFRSPVNSPHKGPVTRKMFPFDDVIMSGLYYNGSYLGLATQPLKLIQWRFSYLGKLPKSPLEFNAGLVKLMLAFSVN